jgi:hypothetical protein
MRIVWKLLEILLVVSSILAFLSALYLGIRWAYTLPRLADPSTGRIFPLVYHGTTVFLTYSQDLLFKCLFYGSLLGFLAAILIHKYVAPFRKAT